MFKNVEITDRITYVANKNETFDLLEFWQYGDEHFADLLMRENPDYCDMLIFEGGEELTMPIINVQEIEDSLPPWRKVESE